MLTATGSGSAASGESETLDATVYARLLGVSFDEAELRIGLQAEIGRLSAALEQNAPNSFAGLYIRHEPDFAIVAQFTKGGQDAIEAESVESQLLAMLEIRQVEHALPDLIRDQSEAVERLRAEGHRFSSEIDVVSNRVIIGALSAAEADSIRAAGARSQSIEVAVVDELPEPSVNLYGGLALSSCTSGFTTYKSTSTNRAITTAGHCGNSQSYAGNALTYQNDGVQSGVYDIQSHKLSGAAYKNWAYDGSAGPGDTTPNYRLITAKRYRVNQDVGDFVCHYGKTTGFGCGWIVSKYTLGCVANASASYIKVDSDPNGPGIDLSEPGDSGGPWYEQNVALGTMSCQQGNDAIYMASDYIETGLSATILTSP